jgi:plastocyanin
MAQAPESGIIAGNVTLTTRVRSARLPAAVYPSRTVSKHDPPAASELRNVVVYLKDVAFRGTLPVTSTEIRQVNETFIPHILPITRGSTVNFSNGDPFFHNVFSLSRASTFDLGRYPKDRARSATFTKPGLVKVFCRIHSQMSATIVVLDHPYFTVPGDDGAFALRNVPPGEYAVAGWHERVGERVATIRVESGKTTDVALALPVEDSK